jgi:hypothetical protein
MTGTMGDGDRTLTGTAVADPAVGAAVYAGSRGRSDCVAAGQGVRVEPLTLRGNRVYGSLGGAATNRRNPS